MQGAVDDAERVETGDGVLEVDDVGARRAVAVEDDARGLVERELAGVLFVVTIDDEGL